MRFFIILFLILSFCVVLPSFSRCEDSDLKKGSMDPCLDFRLIGTVIHKEPMVCFEDTESHRLIICGIGDEIGQAYKVVGIKRGEVFLENNLDKSTMGLWTGAVVSFGRSSEREMIQLSSLVTIRPEVDTKTGDFLGLKLEKIKSDGIIKMTGIKEGDVVNNINGQALCSLQKAVQVIKKAKKLNKIEVGLLRNREPITLKYEFQQ